VKVGEIVANFELGPGAAPDIRAPVVAKHHASCKALSLTAGEATCIARAKATWDMFECAPRMFPDRATGGDCKVVTARMRENILADMPSDVGSAGIAMVDTMVTVIEAACREDNWPHEFRSCITSAPSDDKAAYDKCDGMLPEKLQVQLGERLKPVVKGADDPPKPAP
jgi:hypothetical protein